MVLPSVEAILGQKPPDPCSGLMPLCAQIFYHLEAYPEALHLALESAELFDINERSEYSEKMIGQCIDEYTRARNEAAKNPDHAGPDPRMEAIVMRMFERCFTDGAWSQAVGIAVEARRLDVVQDAVSRAGRSTRAAKTILADAYDAALRFVTTREYRTSVFELLRTVRAGQAASPAALQLPGRHGQTAAATQPRFPCPSAGHSVTPNALLLSTACSAPAVTLSPPPHVVRAAASPGAEPRRLHGPHALPRRPGRHGHHGPPAH